MIIWIIDNLNKMTIFIDVYFLIWEKKTQFCKP